MSRCPQCQQSFPDDYSFCLSDGTVLVPDAPEQPTVVAPRPEVQQAPPVRHGVNPAFAYLAIGLLALIGGAGLLWWMQSSSTVTQDAKASTPEPRTEIANTVPYSANSNQTRTQDSVNQQRPNLQNQQTALEKEKQKPTPEAEKPEAPKPAPNKQLTVDPPAPPKSGTSRIRFRRGRVQETTSGSIGSERSYVLYTLSGQYLSGSVNSDNGCVVFANGSTSVGFTTPQGDNFLRLKNNCEGPRSFSLTVNVK